jgi:hypothetical protein
MDMTKEEVVAIMLERINKDNRALCKHSGMGEAETEAQIEQSQGSLSMICDNLYETLKEKAIIS